MRRSLFIAVLYFLSGCTDSGRVREGYRLLSAGRFEAALEQFERVHKGGRETPELLAGLGLVLSLEQGSASAAADLLEKSLAKSDNGLVRRELVLLLVQMNQLDRALAVMDPERMTTRSFYAPETAVMRAGVQCMQDPYDHTIANLKSSEAIPLAPFFAALCALSPMNQKDRTDKARKLLEDVSEPRLNCELTVMLSRRQSDLLEKAEDCRRKFPDSVVMHRRWHVDSKPVPPRKLFSGNLFEPEDPGIDPVWKPEAGKPETRVDKLPE